MIYLQKPRQRREKAPTGKRGDGDAGKTGRESDGKRENKFQVWQQREQRTIGDICGGDMQAKKRTKIKHTVYIHSGVLGRSRNSFSMEFILAGLTLLTQWRNYLK